MSPLVVLVAVMLAVSGCGTQAPTQQAASALAGPGVADFLPGITDGEPPPECGFPPGTPLIFAGRSTTGRLEVQEVLGDPMSNDPADIYITRDEFDQGQLRGRLVCAVYVDRPGFVEITVVPEGWTPEAGRPPETATPEPTPVPEQPASGIARDEAIATARSAFPHVAAWRVNYVINGPAAEVLLDRDSDPWSDIPRDRWLWRIDFVSGDRATSVFVDFETGEVHGSLDFIVN